MLAAQGPMRFLDFRVLAIDITSNGFAYLVLEGSERLVEWQLVYISPNTISAYLLRLRKIISQYSPEVLVLQEPKRAHHDSRSREILEKFKLQGRQCGLKTFCIDRTKVGLRFQRCGKRKHDIARKISVLFPELRPKLPHPRRIWETEDNRMNLFDAASFGLTALRELEKRQGQHRSRRRRNA